MSLAKTEINTTLNTNWRLRKLIANFGVYIALLVLLLAATVLTPKLYEVNTIAVVMRQASQLGIVAIGQTMILLVAGLDLSVGGIFIMTSIVVAEVTNGRNEMVLPAILIAFGIGALIGAGNGVLVTKRRVPRLSRLLACWFWSKAPLMHTQGACRAVSCRRSWALSISPGSCFRFRCFYGWG